MGRSAEEAVTAEIGRAICERHDLKALIAGSIAPLGSHYVITLEASTTTGDVVAREQAEAEAVSGFCRRSRVTTQLREAASRSTRSSG
jgi:hypothetical protein